MARPTRYQAGGRTGRGRLAAALVALLAVLAAAAVWWQAADSADHGTTAGDPRNAGAGQNPVAAGGYLPTAVAGSDPVSSAVAWLQATRSVSYTDVSPA